VEGALAVKRADVRPALELLIAGKTTAEAAAELHLSYRALMSRFTTYLRRSGCRTILEAAVKFDRERRSDY
jgi:hypothetical protein